VVSNLGLANASGIVRFFDDNRLITTGGSEYENVDVPYKYEPSVNNFKTVETRWIPNRWGVHKISIKIYSLQFELNYDNNFITKQVEVEFNIDPPSGPDLSVNPYNINPSKTYPRHGEDLNISVIVRNIGDQPIRIGDTFNITVSLGNITKYTLYSFGIPARDSVEIFMMFFEIGPGGTTNITVNLDPENVISEAVKSNNFAVRDLQILPSILIVDDDKWDMGKRDVTTILMKSLTARGITFDYYRTKGDDDINPQYSGGIRKLKNFDIVIWLTGYEKNYTLTSTNIKHLTTWLDEPGTTNRLWLIGQDILNDTVLTPGIPQQTEFPYEYLGISGYQWNGTPELLNGTPGDEITDGMVLNTSGYLSNQNRGLNLTIRSPTGNETLNSILGNELILGPVGSSALKYHNLSNSYKVVFMGFEVTSLSSAFDLSNVTYHVLKWFNYTLEQGYDFSIVDQSFSTITPEFMDIITISATVVNNGPDDEDVYILFYVSDSTGQEFEIPTFPDDVANPKEYFIRGRGGRRMVTKQWLASSVGEHNFRVMVDPFDQYNEVVEENNDFSYYGVDVTQLKIQYTVLVVDDDNSTNNGGSYPDTVTPIIEVLTELNYYYVTTVVTGGATPGNGPSIDVLKHYNCVLWLTGDDSGPTLTLEDQASLESYLYGSYIEARYLKVKVNLLLVGQNILDDLNGSGNNIVPGVGFVRDYLKVSRYTTGVGLGDELEGVQFSDISHGSRYPLEKSFPDRADMITSSKNNYLFWQDRGSNNYNSINYEHERNHSRIIFLPWELSFVNSSYYPKGAGAHENYLNEAVFLMMDWFRYPYDSAELKVVDIDINISEENPFLGQSYIINVDVYNYGSKDCSGIIRFYDGNTIIDTDTIYIQSGSKTSSEIIWVPLYAGNRTISVRVDIDNDVPEIFDVLNNVAVVPNYWVYYFYDDMEDGISNWKHESTLIRINGESTLDYMDDPIYSNVNSSWLEINKFNRDPFDYYSADYSFYTTEPMGISSGGNVLLAIVIDDSASMSARTDASSNTWLDVAKDAAKYLVSQLTDDSKVCIWHFKGNNEERALTLTTLDGTGRNMVNSAITLLDNPSGTTILWDAIGSGYEDVKNAAPSYPGLSPAVIVLSDGMDLQASDKSGLSTTTARNKIEGGSNVWSPWHEMYVNNITAQGYKSSYYARHYGKYTIDWANFNNNTYWIEAMAQGSMEHTRRGLLNSDIPIYTIGLGLENHTIPNEPIITNWPGDFTLDTTNATCTDSSPFCIESGTLEYNLWRIATTSNASYFYSPTSDELKGIFGQIAQALGATLTRSTRSTRAPTPIYNFGFETDWDGWSQSGTQDEWERGDPSDPSNFSPRTGSNCLEIDLNGDYNNDANFWLYREINLQNYTDVEMTFWHYFETEYRDDGGCLMISDDGGSSWTLAPPTLPSSGWRSDMTDNYYGKLVHRYGWTGNHPMGGETWEKVTIDLSAWDGKKILMRFWFSSDGGTDDDGWALDDFEITGNKKSGIVGQVGEPGDRYLTTHTFNLENTSQARVIFYHKYNLMLGMNGVVVLVGTPNSTGNWSYEYTNPKQPYTGNFDLGKNRYDDYGNLMRWCWNGISRSNLYEWEYVEIPLDNWTGLPEVRVRILFLWSNWARNGGYMIDDFEIRRQHDDDVSVASNETDQWQLTSSDSYSGNFCWWNGDPTSTYLNDGMDNSLITRSIDMTNARNATLSAYLKFNINTAAGRPPDGFRVEISSDNGVSWDGVNVGVRAAWGVSGNGTDADDGIPNDGKSYTGLNVGSNWIETGSLTRLNCDLTGWAGKVIQLRFRVVTAANGNPFTGSKHYESATVGFGGLYVDDVVIHGFSLQK
jgi:hypothetical protein